MQLSSQIESLHIYPVKGMGGIDLESALLTPEGLKMDRRYMLVDADGKFISQRKYPALARFRPSLIENGVVLSLGNDEWRIDERIFTGKNEEVQLWKDKFLAELANEETNQWISDRLESDVQLVYFGDSSYRMRNRNGVIFKTAFADGYPILVCNRESMNSLNEQMEEDLPIDRFRPNIVVSGLPEYRELVANSVMVRSSESLLLRKCERCSVPTVDQASGERSGKEPTSTLTRMYSGTPVFGVNVVFDKKAMIRKGDQMTWGIPD